MAESLLFQGLRSRLPPLIFRLVSMPDLGFLLLFALMALLAAWLVNFLVGLLSGEHPGDTRSVWWDMLFGEFCCVGRMLNYINASWARRILAVVGFIALAIAIVRACIGE